LAFPRMPHSKSHIAALFLLAALNTHSLAQSGTPSSQPARTKNALADSMTATPQTDTRAQFSLLHASGLVQPATTTTLALHFTIDDDWHLYYNGLAEEGMEPRWEFTLPPDWQITGEPAWPAPKRKAANELTVEHIYEHSLTLLLPVSIPADAALGPVTITASAKWIVCKDVCLSESAETTLRLRVVADAASSADPAAPPPKDSKEPRHIIARAAQAAALPGLDSPKAAKLGLRGILSTADSLPALTFEASGEVTGLAFFPAQGSTPLETDVQDWSAEGSRLVLELAPLETSQAAVSSTQTPPESPSHPPLQALGFLEVRLRNAAPTPREYFRVAIRPAQPPAK
jgi:DsbC/DsbD-like thiol-disulfide interchange protein